LAIDDFGLSIRIADRGGESTVRDPQSAINPQSAIRDPHCEGVVKFVAAGSPRVVSRAIEEFARSQGHVTAIVVPWESDDTTLSMAVTAVKSDGWAIEHTNHGTIRLADAGQDRTDVAIAAEIPDHPEPQSLAAVFDRFVRQVQSRLHVESPES
jgi:hypothetical protein